MPKNKDLKRVIRTRMQKTGESYTAARANVVRKRLPADLAKIAGISDKAVHEKTGRTWTQWVRLLDRASATSMPHKDIAKLLREQHDTPAWWAQSVTVGYERIRGLRDVGQHRGGSYVANKSKTFPVPVSTLYKAFAIARIRNRWLDDQPTVRTSSVDKSVRFDWPDGTRVQAYFTAKGASKCQVQIQHDELADKADIERRKTYWAARFAVLRETLAG